MICILYYILDILSVINIYFNYIMYLYINSGIVDSNFFTNIGSQ